MKFNLFDYSSKYRANKSRFSSKSLFGYTIWGILITSLLPNLAIAKETFSTPTTQFKVTFDPPAKDMPRSSVGGASRTIGQCLNTTNDSARSFSALLPTSSPALTAASHPTILAYLPKTSAQNVFFSWHGEDNQDHYQTILPLEQKAGIVSLNLPKNAPPLEVGKSYQWAVGIMCDGRLQPDSPMIQGQVKRVELASTVQNSLDDDISLKNAALYGENGLWYETAATLAELIAAEPNNKNFTSNWQELLNSVGLNKVADAPINISSSDDR
ncbi:MAG: DUF928 domain-containing protein [Cyanobacteria bacterium P01_A01_bin.40]